MTNSFKWFHLIQHSLLAELMKFSQALRRVIISLSVNSQYDSDLNNRKLNSEPIITQLASLVNG
jgi:hypothetical protein